MAIRVRIRLFRAFSLNVEGRETVTRFPTRKTAALLAYLALHLGQPQARDLLGESIWPDAEPTVQH